jgi:sugar O-acyltransferase (sialic acid O-acetyltransferase NeuD family)
MITRLVIVGAGGHGRVVADIIDLLKKQIKLIGFLDDDIRLKGKIINNKPVLGRTRALRDIEYDEVVVTIGDNILRKKLFFDILNYGNRFSTICHPNSIISPTVELGQGTQIIGGVVVNTGSRIGQNSIINTGCTIDHDNWIGDHVHIAPGVHLGGSVVIDDDTFIGMGVIVAPQCKIGKGCIIGAGSIVLKDISDGQFAYGTPATPQSRGEKTAKSLTFKGNNHLLHIFEEAIEAELGTVNDSQALSDIEGWDSMALLGLIALVDDRYGITIDLESLANSKNVADILNLIDSQISGR